MHGNVQVASALLQFMLPDTDLAWVQLLAMQQLQPTAG